MKSSAVRTCRCIHCLRPTEKHERDHIFPKAWYPDSTPSTVQRWTAPSCDPCNRKHGQLENDLLIRSALCFPDSEAVVGLGAKVFRALGLDTQGVPAGEQAIRDQLRAKIRNEIFPHEEAVAFGGKPQDSLILIPHASWAIMAEKIARGCEWNWNKSHRFVEPPYGVFISSAPEGIPENMRRHSEARSFGPGFSVVRMVLPEVDRLAVAYHMTIWGSERFLALIDREETRRYFDEAVPRAGGFLPPTGRAMKIPEYLRSYKVPLEGD